MQNFIGIVFIGVLIYFVAISPMLLLLIIGLLLIHYLVKNQLFFLWYFFTSRIRHSSKNKDKYYQLMKDITTAIKKHTLINLNKSLEFFSNKIGENKEKIVKEYSSSRDELASVNKLELDKNISKSVASESEIPIQVGATNSQTTKQISLIEVVEKQDFNLLKKLIENGANLNEQNKDGNNALMIAVMTDKNTDNQVNISKQHEIIKYLLENGADAFHKNKYNYNVFDIMKHKSHYAEIQKIVEKHIKNNVVENTKNQDELLNKANLENIIINQVQEVEDAAKQHLTSEIASLNQRLASQQAEINLANNKLSVTQEEADKKIQELLSKIELLEKKSEVDNKKTVIPAFTTPSIKETSLIKNDGVVVRRDSLDDF